MMCERERKKNGYVETREETMFFCYSSHQDSQYNQQLRAMAINITESCLLIYGTDGNIQKLVPGSNTSVNESSWRIH
jgi:hypothetical protein